MPYLKANTANRFLNRIGNEQVLANSNLEYSVLVFYYQGKLPDSFATIFNQYPDYCTNQENIESCNRLIIICPTFYFGKIFELSKKLECKEAYQQFLSCIETPKAEFSIRDQIWVKEKPRVMGILNITPDSFYDGGENLQEDDYIESVIAMIQAGADIIDIGGESTRPGSKSVNIVEEIKRVLPALKKIRSRFNIPISIDTVKPEVAEIALKAGADMINDVSGLANGEKMLSVINQYNASYCLMHTQGNPETMQKNPDYIDVLAEVLAFFDTKIKQCLKNNLSLNRIVLDPGIGFGKLVEHNLDLLRYLTVFQKLGCLILQGSSNKGFIGKVLNRDVDARLTGTLTTQSFGLLNGATIFRVHQVAENKDALLMAASYLDNN